MQIEELEEVLKIKFKNKPLLKQALTHSSYANEKNLKSNERLEYLGDAVLELCASKYMYSHFSCEEGILTKKRAQVVREEALNIYANKIELDKYLLLGRGEEKIGGRHNKAIIADAFEALFGAVFLDFGFDMVYDLFTRLVVPSLEEVTNIRDYKSIFQEEIQSEKRSLRYETLPETGPTFNKPFEVFLYIDGLLYGKGSGKTKKEAEQNAAKEALEKRAK